MPTKVKKNKVKTQKLRKSATKAEQNPAATDVQSLAKTLNRRKKSRK